MSYRVQYAPAAERTLRKLLRRDPESAKDVATAVAGLSADPRPYGFIPLTGRPGEFRIRVGTYRVIYHIEDSQLTVLVLTIGHRRDVYRH